jgi:NTE family protein
MPSLAAEAANRDVQALEIVPKVDGVGLQDWKAFAPAVEAGYRATMEAADRLTPLAI